VKAEQTCEAIGAPSNGRRIRQRKAVHRGSFNRSGDGDSAQRDRGYEVRGFRLARERFGVVQGRVLTIFSR
jgi:hypothetical protein